MEIYFIRHSHAVERVEWEGDDLTRPLTRKGIQRANKAFKKVSKIFNIPELIICSNAERSKKTGEILNKYYKTDIIIDDRLNPGVDLYNYREIINELEESGKKSVAIIGHEPELSKFISFWVSDGTLNIIMRKGSLCHVDNKIIINLIQQKLLAGEVECR